MAACEAHTLHGDSFVFDNVTRHASMTGGSGKAQNTGTENEQRLDKFCTDRQSQPRKSAPVGSLYSPKGATMCFDNVCEEKYNHDKELMELLRAFPTRGL